MLGALANTQFSTWIQRVRNILLRWSHKESITCKYSHVCFKISVKNWSSTSEYWWMDLYHLNGGQSVSVGPSTRGTRVDTAWTKFKNLTSSLFHTIWLCLYKSRYKCICSAGKRCILHTYQALLSSLGNSHKRQWKLLTPPHPFSRLSILPVSCIAQESKCSPSHTQRGLQSESQLLQRENRREETCTTDLLI